MRLRLHRRRTNGPDVGRYTVGSRKMLERRDDAEECNLTGRGNRQQLLPHLPSSPNPQSKSVVDAPKPGL